MSAGISDPVALKSRKSQPHSNPVLAASLCELIRVDPFNVREGVMEFVRSQDDYAENFGFQWNRYRSMQIDSESGGHESEQRFFAETGWSPESLSGKIILDAGCGAGRFAEVAVRHGARVVAVDLSQAVYACAKTLSQYPAEQHLVLRANIFELPFHVESFDGIYSLGVLHHTPDPLGALQALVPFLKPGGQLAAWIYEKRSPDVSKLQPRTWLRRLTRTWSIKRKVQLSQALTASFFPVGWSLSWLGRTGERLSHFLPYAARHHLGRGDLFRQWEYSVMDTFDWYGPHFDSPQREADVARSMREVGLTAVQRLPARGMAIVGERPAHDDTVRLADRRRKTNF